MWKASRTLKKGKTVIILQQIEDKIQLSSNKHNFYSSSTFDDHTASLTISPNTVASKHH